MVSWVKDGKTLSHIRNGYIKINDVTSDDAGVYTCTSKQIITRPKRLTIRQSTVTTVKVHGKSMVKRALRKVFKFVLQSSWCTHSRRSL